MRTTRVVVEVFTKAQMNVTIGQFTVAYSNVKKDLLSRISSLLLPSLAPFRPTKGV
jgi:hypothetical protein